jgi:hypothetical protein
MARVKVHFIKDCQKSVKALLVAFCSNLDMVSFTYMRSAADCILTTSQSVSSQ